MMELEIAHDYLQCMKLFSDLSFLTIANHPLLFNIHSTRVSGGICFLSVHKLTRLNTVSRPSIHLTFCTPPFLYNHPNFTHSAQSPLLSFIRIKIKINLIIVPAEVKTFEADGRRQGKKRSVCLQKGPRLDASEQQQTVYKFALLQSRVSVRLPRPPPWITGVLKPPLATLKAVSPASQDLGPSWLGKCLEEAGHRHVFS